MPVTCRPRPLRPKPGVMGGAVPRALKLRPDTRLSSGSAAQLIAGLALDPSGYLGGQPLQVGTASGRGGRLGRRGGPRARSLQASPDQADGSSPTWDEAAPSAAVTRRRSRATRRRTLPRQEQHPIVGWFNTGRTRFRKTTVLSRSVASIAARAAVIGFELAVHVSASDCGSPLARTRADRCGDRARV